MISGLARRKFVLIADDEPNIVTALEYLLQSNGYAVLIARSGTEALQQIEAHCPDLLLLDVMLPMISGYEVCRRVRERPAWRSIRIVMLSAKGREVEMSAGLSLGADLYMTKPFSTNELISNVRRLLGDCDA